MMLSHVRRYRLLWMRLHRWLALSLGVLLAFVALLGAALTIAKPLDRWTHRELFRAASAAPLGDGTLEQVRRALGGEFGDQATLTLRPPRAPGETLWAAVRGPWQGTVYFDPASGRELGRRGEHEGPYNLMFELHSSLLMEDTGKAVRAHVGVAAPHERRGAAGGPLERAGPWRAGLHLDLSVAHRRARRSAAHRAQRAARTRACRLRGQRCVVVVAAPAGARCRRVVERPIHGREVTMDQERITRADELKTSGLKATLPRIKVLEIVMPGRISQCVSATG